ncbi:MAG TPA: hypothetical protein VD997_15725 [Phycisphaerales bacterium]|nr:hypothetical protein [Phycisphaerales bacterium]
MQRQPGIIGLWEEPFSSGDPLPGGGAIDPGVAGPDAFTRAQVAVAGVAPPDPLDVANGFAAELLSLATGLGSRLGAGISAGLPTGMAPQEPMAEEEPEHAELPDRHRIMEFMGTKIKVICNPGWTEQARALADAPEPSEDAIEAFFAMVSARHPAMQAEIAASVCPYMRAQGKDELADRLGKAVSVRAPRKAR